MNGPVHPTQQPLAPFGEADDLLLSEQLAPIHPGDDEETREALRQINTVQAVLIVYALLLVGFVFAVVVSA